MAQTTNIVLSKSDGWVEVATGKAIIRVKANSGNWISWRIYFSEAGAPTDYNVGALYNGNKDLEFKNYSGTLYLYVTDVNESIGFSITTQTTI